MLARIRLRDIILWSFRRNASDVVKLYDSLSPVMQLATGGDMLNFGYWTQGYTTCPNDAQRALCSLVASEAEFGTKKVLDVGSGLCAPAMQWRSEYEKSQIYCVNINFNQLKYSHGIQGDRVKVKSTDSSSVENKALILEQSKKDLSFVNATSTELPFLDGTIDTVIALESAQHFWPFEKFVSESRRVLVTGGSLIIAIPVLLRRLNFMSSLFRLGILSLTWSSEHYHLDYLKSAIQNHGFKIANVIRIGHDVYEPLADYYVANRIALKEKILTLYPPFVESMLYHSILKMRELSKKEIIDYAIIRAD